MPADPIRAALGGVTSATVKEAMQTVDRRWFLPPDQRSEAAGDYPLPIGYGQTNSQPSTVAAMLDLLDVGEQMSVLDVGAGSGWTTALLAHLVGSSGSVVGVELEPELAQWGADNLQQCSMPWAKLLPARQDILGWPEEGPYDRVLVSAGAKRMPDELVEQIGADGIMVIVVGSTMLRVARTGEAKPEVTEHGPYRFVPLR